MTDQPLALVDGKLIVTKEFSDEFFQGVKYTLSDIYDERGMEKPTDQDVIDFLNKNQDVLFNILKWDEFETTAREDVWDKFN